MTVYYNEFDPQTAEWLRELIMAGVIADGVVDTRSIEDVRPADLEGFTQCHFFAGIGVWSYALRAAGWPDDRPVWTGSCPCQPFSAAGKGLAFADERHLWPAFYHLIAQHADWCRQKKRPIPTILGEQVASKDVDPWIDLVHADLEALGYAFGSVPFPSAGVGSPHIRDRNYWVAHATDQRLDGRRASSARDGRDAAWVEPERFCDAGGLADNASSGRREERADAGRFRPGDRAQRIAAGFGNGRGLGGLADSDKRGRAAHAGAELHDTEHHPEPRGGAIGLGHANRKSTGRDTRTAHSTQVGHGPQGGDDYGLGHAGDSMGAELAGPTNGFWRDADWLGCRDGKWRPVEPGSFPLVDGLAAGMGALSAGQRRLAEMAGLDAASLKRAKAYRPGALRGFGNAINAQAARIWIETVMACQP